MRTRGLELGDARDEIVSHYSPGTMPFLRGWTGMLPFHIPWELQPEWIRYPSSKMSRGRAQYMELFRNTKVILSTRASKHGNAWRVRAAVDRRGLLPSNQFTAIASEAPLTCDLLAAILNSALVNCWLRLNNAADTLTVASLMYLPVPARIQEDMRAPIEEKAHRLETIWRSVAAHGGSEEVPAEALAVSNALDDDIYTLYQIPHQLRAEISQFFIISGDSRPGFNTPGVIASNHGAGQARPSRVSARRMKRLFEAQEERGLTADEASELQELVEQWERLNVESESLLSRPAASHDAR